MYLMKSCNAEHRLHLVGSIRFGTLNYFRKHPDPEIGDRTEAELYTKLLIDRPRIYENDLLDRVMRGSMEFGEGPLSIQRPFRCLMNQYEGVMATAQTTRVDVADIDYVTSGSDALIFCMTIVNSLGAPPRMGYSNRWLMKRQKACQFAELVENVFNSLSDEELTAFSPHSSLLGRYKNARFSVTHRPVKYRSRQTKIWNPDELSLTQHADDLENSDLIKDDAYRHQEEYRFSVRLMDGWHLLPLNPSIEYFDIGAHPFRSFDLGLHGQ